MTTTTTTQRPFWASRTFLISVGAGLLALVLLVGAFSTANRVQKQGIAYETQLTAQYLDNQNELSTLVSNFYEQLGIADAKSEKMDQIIVNAVKGRYDDTGVQFGGTDGALFSAMVEAYPDLAGLNIYDQVAATISAGREAYKQKQTKLLDMLRTYDDWRQAGLIHRMIVSAVGFPSITLRAQIGEEAVTGQAALDQMYVIVTTSQARAAYEDGNLDPLEVPGG